MLEQLDTLIGFVTVITVASLIVTVLTQMISGLLALRGAHLRDGLVEVVKATARIGGPEAEKLVTAVLTDPLLSDKPSKHMWSPAYFLRRYGLASAVRYEEFADGLKRVVRGTEAATETVVSLLKGLSEVDGLTPETAQLLTDAANLPAKGKANVQKRVAALQAALDSLSREFERTFNSAMERTQERFAASTRKSNLILGLLVAFFLQLDSFDLFRRISSDANLRTQLVKASGTVLKEGDDILQRATETPAHRQPAILAEMKKDLEGARAAAKPDSPEARILDMLLKVATDPDFSKTLQTPPAGRALVTNGEWDARVAEVAEPKFAAIPEAASLPATDRFVAAYGKARAKVTRAMLETLKGDLARSSDLLAGTGLQLIPEKYPANFREWFSSPRHCGGMLMTALLLSLGAPYWFNLLKTLSSLRPVLAENVRQSPEKPLAERRSQSA